jgi:glycerol kinase
LVIETTALGAAYAAGLAVGYWSDLDTLCSNWTLDRAWEPQWNADRRDAAHHAWQRAVQRSF